MRILFSPDPAEATPAAEPENPQENPGTPPPGPQDRPGQAPGPPAPPQAATIVVTGDKTERELALERDMKERETRIAELEDENHRLKAAGLNTRPEPAREKSLTDELNDWLDGK